MIFLMDSGSSSRLYIATIVFYTCIWIPVKQMKQAILDIFSSIHEQFQQPSGPVVVVDFAAARFSELPAEEPEYYGTGRDEGKSHRRGCPVVEERCSLCLAEYKGVDMVIRLPRCGHVFHMDCFNSWVERNQFTCPLCRDLFLHQVSPHAR